MAKCKALTGSAVKGLKSFLNTITSQARLNSIAIITCYHEIQPGIADVMTHFVGLSDFRRKMFGNL